MGTKSNKSKKGFTLFETVAALIIVTLISTVLVQGIVSAVSVYNRSTFLSESETLTSTINTELSDILRYAKFDYKDSSNKVHFTNENYTIEKGTLVEDDSRIKIVPSDTGVTKENYISILDENTYSTVKISDFALSYNNGVFSGSYKLRSSKINVSAKKVEFSFKTLND